MLMLECEPVAVSGGGWSPEPPPGLLGRADTQGQQAVFSLCRPVPGERAASEPGHGNGGGLAARGTVAPAAGAQGRVGHSVAGAGHGAPWGAGQGCLGPPHPRIREWLNYSGFAATGTHGQAGGREARPG